MIRMLSKFLLFITESFVSSLIPVNCEKAHLKIFSCFSRLGCGLLHLLVSVPHTKAAFRGRYPVWQVILEL